MPPDTPATAQATRLEVAGWTQHPAHGPVCRVPHTEWWPPQPFPDAAAIAPLWLRIVFAVTVYVLMMALMFGPMWLLGSRPGVPGVVNGLLVTAAWWGFIALRWWRRR